MKAHIDLNYLVGACILVVLLSKSSYFSLGNLMGALLILDLGIAIITVICGMVKQNSGLIVGGSICGIIASSSVSSLWNPTGIDLFLQIAGGLLGVGSFIVTRQGEP